MAKYVTSGNERKYQGKGITLRGAEFAPKDGEPLGTIYFVPGISAIWDDYMPLLVPLAARFRICAYNQRGHGDSQGKFDIRKAADDLEEVIEKDNARPAGILAHSLDGMAVQVAKRFEEKGNNLQGVYLMEPFLGMEFLHAPQRKMIYALHRFAPALGILEDLLDTMPKLRKQLGFNNRNVISSYGSLAHVNSEESKGANTFVGYMLADNDAVLGTNNEQHYQTCLKRLEELFPFAENDSSIVKGLNHCLNRKKLVPFLRNEKDKPKDAIITLIQAFFYSLFTKDIKRCPYDAEE